jgi:hypothetical protein
MLRPSPRAFFYMGPLHPAPSLDFLLVPFSGTPLGLLAAPLQRTQNLPHVCRVIPHSEVLLDHLGHTLQRPKIAAIALSLWPLQQKLQKLLLLPCGKAARSSRMRFRHQPLHPVFFHHLLPKHHGRWRAPHKPGHRSNTKTLFQKGYRPSSPGFQDLGTSRGSHAINYMNVHCNMQASISVAQSSVTTSPPCSMHTAKPSPSSADDTEAAPSLPFRSNQISPKGPSHPQLPR